MESIVYSRERERTKPLSILKKLIYGIGELPFGLLNGVTGTGLMLYYVQIIGVSASSIGLLIGFAFLVDALTDPILAEFSDRLRSRLGRRHGLMYASAIPFGLSIYFLMAPPQGLDDAMVLTWVGFFLVLTRLCYTVFSVPYEALLPELGGDYEGRASLAAWRRLSAWLVSTIAMGFVMLVIFAGSDAYPQGQLNPDAYPSFALFTGLCVAISILVTTYFTQDQIPYLLQPQASSHIEPRMLRSSIAPVIANRNLKNAQSIGKLISTKYYIAEYSDDIIGVEVCSAIKNIYSMIIGAGQSLNSSSNLFQKSLIEMRYLTRYFKGKEETISGLAGVGDLYVSAAGGRNSKMGSYLGKGFNFKTAKKRFMPNDTVEGEQLAREIAPFILKKIDKKKVPLMVNLLTTIISNKKLKIKV